MVDIGGGSTELVVGEKFKSSHLASLKIELRQFVVALSRVCFDNNRITGALMYGVKLLVQPK